VEIHRVYLGRSCRTGQRWQEEYGLPVRHVGGVTGSVFAYTRELDSWLRSRLPPVEPVDCSCASVPEEAKERSEALVALAKRMWQVPSNGNLGTVAQTFRQAIDYECTNAGAFVGLSAALIVKSLLGGLDVQGALTSAKAALRRASELDPTLPEAICMSGWIKILEERD